jgi:4-hydroxy-3-methylbut-2-en-1-yl diphosphate reductase
MGDMTSAAATKRVLLAKPRGYCAGVDRAVQTVEQALEHYGAPVYVRKQIVHNLHVVRALEARGAVFVDETSEIPEGSVVVFSAHGVAPSVHLEAAARDLTTIDATCPLVTKVHYEAKRFAADGYDIVLIGHEGHEEVIGTTGEAPAHITLVDGPGDVAKLELDNPSQVVWLSQTTLSVDETMQTVDALHAKFPEIVSPPSDDICYATQNRQAAVKQIAPDVDLFLVVGSSNSSNSVRMVEVAKAAGAKAAHLVETADFISRDWLQGVSTIGLSSGASVPEILVDAAVARLAEWGFEDLIEVEHIEERLVFALPPELRRELKLSAKS